MKYDELRQKSVKIKVGSVRHIFVKTVLEASTARVLPLIIPVLHQEMMSFGPNTSTRPGENGSTENKEMV